MAFDADLVRVPLCLVSIRAVKIVFLSEPLKRQQSLLDRYDAQIVGMRAEPSSSLFSKEIVDRPYKDCD